MTQPVDPDDPRARTKRGAAIGAAAGAIAGVFVGDGEADEILGTAAIGFGEADPIADNATAGGRALNRRVEILIKGKT